MATIKWTGSAGDSNFNNPANWSPAQVPGASDTVTISQSAATLINISQADAVQALSTNAKITLSINDNSSLSVGNAATKNAALANNGVIELNANNYAAALIVAGPQVTLSGSGTIALNNNGGNLITATAASDVLNNTGNVIEGTGRLGGGTLTFVNGAGGIVDANLGGQIVINTGTVAVSNAGLLEATGNGGGLVIQSGINNGAGGHIAAAGGTVYLSNSAVIAGGTLSSSGGFAILDVNSATLDGTTNAVTNTGTVAIADNSALGLLGGIVNQGQIAFDSNNYNSDLIIGPGGAKPGTVTLTGGGTVALAPGGGSRIYGAISGDTLVNQNNTIEGAGQLGHGTLTLINDGTINANDGNALYVNTDAALTNNALMEATGAGGLVLQTVVNDSGGGTILAAGGIVYLNGGTLQGGTVQSTGGGALNVGFNNAGTLDGSTQTVTNDGQINVIDAATLSLLGTITNAGTIAVDANNYATSLLIAGATVTLTGGGTVLLDNSSLNRITGAAASDVLVNANNLIEGAGQLGLGSLTFTNAAAGIVDANTGAQLVLNTGSTISNAGLLEATAGSGGLVIQCNVSNGSAGRIAAAGGNVFLASGADITGGTLSSSGAGTILDSNSATLGAVSGRLTNTGTVALQDNTTLSLLGTILNQGAIALDANNYNTDLVTGTGTVVTTVTLTGSGTISLDDNGLNRIYAAASGDTLVNLDNTITGAGQIGVGTGLILVNDSIINAVGGNRLTINTGAVVTNNALLEASGSGGLYLQGTINDSAGGTILAATGNVALNGATVEGGIINSLAGAAVFDISNATLDGSGQTVTNKGVVNLNDNTTLTLLGTITNTGTIAVNANNYNTDLIAGGPTVTLTGGGTILLGNNGGNRIYGASATDVLVNINNVIEGAGQLGVGQLTLVNGAAGIIDANDTSGLILTGGGTAVTNAGLIESTGSGGLTIETAVNGSTGGTILANGGNVYLYGATIQGGLLATGANGGIFDVNGNSTLDGSAAAVTNASASVVAINDNVTLTMLGSIVNHGSIDINANNYNTDLIAGAGTTTLSGGGTILLDNSFGNRIYGATGSDVLVNVDNLIEGAGQIGAGQLTLINEAGGIIDANATNGLALNGGAVAIVNDGLIEATGSGGLFIQSALDGSGGGTILANGGNIYLNGGILQGGTIRTEAGGALVVDGGGTLDGSAHLVTNDGAIAVGDGQTLTLLGAIDNQGTISLSSGNYITDLIIGSPTLTLTGSGTITLGGDSGNRFYGATAATVLDNVSNTIDGGGQLGAGQLTLINSGIIAGTSGSALVINLGSTGLNTATGELLGVGAGGLILQNGTYTNMGTIQADNGSFVTLQTGAVLTNDNATGTLTGGTYAAMDTGNNATVNIAGAAVNTLDATLELAGAGSEISFGGVTIDASLDAISAGGTFDLLAGRNFIATANAGTFTDNGAIVLGGGSFTANDLTIGTTGSFTGFGTIDGPIVNDGLITVEGGELLINGALTGTGTVTTGTGGIVVLNGGGTLIQPITGTGTLLVQGGTYTLTQTSVTIANVDVTAGAALSGSGLITGALLDAGTVMASAGKLTLSGQLSGNGTLSAAAGATLIESGGGTFSGMIEGAGKIHLKKAITLNAGTTLAARHVIDTANISLGAGANVMNGRGDMFSIGTAAVPGTPHRAQTLVINGSGSLGNTGTIDSLSNAQIQVAFANTGLVSVAGGTLGLQQTVSGAGTYAVATGAVLDIAGGGSFAAALQGAGTVQFDSAFTLNQGASFAALSVIDTNTLALASGESLTNLAGNSFLFQDATGKDTPHRAQAAVNGGSGSSFTNAGTVSSTAASASFGLAFVNAGAVSASAGTLAFLGAATNNGAVAATGAAIDFSASVAGTGTLAIGAAGTISLLAGAAGGQTAAFQTTSGLLDLGHPLSFLGTIQGFGAGDQIDLLKTAETGYSFANGTLTVANGSNTVASLHFSGSYTTADFSLVSDGHAGTLITFV